MTARYEHAGLDEPDAMMVARAFVEWGQAEGRIPQDRAALTEGEEVFFACVTSPAGTPEIVGGAVFYQPEEHDMLFLDILYVSPSCRRQGIGRGLIDAVCREAEARGVSQVRFGTGMDNAPMQSLARSCGFADYALFMNRKLDAGAAG